MQWGIKEGCPLSPTFFVLVYEAFRQTLTEEFPNSMVLAYVDDIAIISPNKQGMKCVLDRVSQLSAVVGLRTNSDKTHIYRCPPPPHATSLASTTWNTTYRLY